MKYIVYLRAFLLFILTVLVNMLLFSQSTRQVGAQVDGTASVETAAWQTVTILMAQTATRVAELATTSPSITPTLPPFGHALSNRVLVNGQWTEQLIEDHIYISTVRGFDIEMIFVPAGCFVIGNDPDAMNGLNADRSRPIMGVPSGGVQCLDAFYIDTYEVTNEQYTTISEDQSATGQWHDPNRPREMINWSEASDFCLVRGGRLPSEIEWEYTARGPSALQYPWGNLFNVANVVSSHTQEQGTAPVGSIPSGRSWVGAYDMSGNVYEWTSSIAGTGYNSAMPVVGDPLAAEYIIRGGSYSNPQQFVQRSASRFNTAPTSNAPILGFRCVRDAATAVN